jgi:DNA helicase-2/ATP-dependent DNA helicase PcrA
VTEYVLNASQKAIVEADETPLLVVAGPGAGKTTVLRARIERVLSESPYNRVLAITFTNVAAANLRSRLEDLTRDDLQRVRIGTFHSFAASILQQHGTHLDLQPDFNISNEGADRREIYSEAVAAAGRTLDENVDYLPLIGRLLECGATKGTVSNFIDSSIDAETVAEILEQYVCTSVAKGELDFALLVYLANKLLAETPGVAKQIRRTYKYICVDEFQDTNDAQFRLLEAICKDRTSGLLLLANQDQVIYQWNGASVGRLAEATNVFNAQTTVLPTSFRCPDAIIRAASCLIAHNPSRFVTPVFESAIDRRGSITVKSFPTENAEESWVASQLQSLSHEQYDETAVLARNRKRLNSLLVTCNSMNIPSTIPTPQFEFVSPPLVLLHSILRLAQRFQRRHLDALCNSLATVTGVVLDASTLVAEAAATDAPVLEVFVERSRSLIDSVRYSKVCSYILGKLLARKDFWGLSDLYFAWITEHQAQASDVYSADFDEEKPIWVMLERMHKGLQSDQVTLSEFLRRLDLESKAPPANGRVRLLTVHGAKGLEFDRVFLLGASEGQFPSFQAVKQGDASQAIQEERRSFFVAITRCKADLTVTYPTSYMGYEKQASRFIAEMALPPG